MVHPSVRDEPAGRAFHSAFIATRLAAGACAVLVLPVYLALWGAPHLLAVICFAWLAAPLLIAFYVSRTGRLDIGQLLSAASLSGLVVFMAAATGGPASALLVWLVVVPVEAALSGSARTVLGATAIAVLAALGLLAADMLGVIPPAAVDLPVWALPLLGALPAVLYGGVVAAHAVGTARGLAGRAGMDSRRLADLVEAVGDPILTLTRSGNVITATANTTALTGCPVDLLSGDGLFARVHVSDRPAYLKALDEAAGGAEAVAEFRLRRDAGSDAGTRVPEGYGWVEMRARRLPAAGAGARRTCADVVVALRDVCPRKARETQLSHALEEAERTSLAKGRFLANMSHELRTPLNAIIGFSEILAGEMPGPLDPDQHREYAGLIRDSGRHLLDVVNDILDMSKIETGKFEIFPEPFDVTGLVRSCCQMMETQAGEAGLRIDMDLPEAFPELNADRRACKQILLNLLSNAIKFSRPGGRIVVGGYRDPAGVALYVADEGIGIARTDLPRLGDPFVQVHASYDRRYEGTGLGLSVVKGLAALHGGSVDIDSEVGHGTRVTVRLPVAENQPIGSAAPVELLRRSA